MNQRIPFIILSTLLWVLHALAQGDTGADGGDSIASRILDYYRKVPQDRVYVQTDKPYYAPGDTLWFRAHVVDGVTNVPVQRSRFVYVELHDVTADTLMVREMVKCDSLGVFANAIVLPKGMKGGHYALAAYTQWMMNFGEERFFYKDIRVAGGSTDDDMTVEPVPTTGVSPLAADLLQTEQRKGYLLIQPVIADSLRGRSLSLVLHGSGNLLVRSLEAGRPMRIPCRSMRTGMVTLSLLDDHTEKVMAERQVFIEGGNTAKVSITGQTATKKGEMVLDISILDGSGQPLKGVYALSVTDLDVVKPDTTAANITKVLLENSGYARQYCLEDMLGRHYPDIRYGYETSQTISGRVKATLTKNLRNARLHLITPHLARRQEFKLADSSRFVLSDLDFPDGTTFLLEATRKGGSNSMIQLYVDEKPFPQLKIPRFRSGKTEESPIPDDFSRYANFHQKYNSMGIVELPEVTTVAKKPVKYRNRARTMPTRMIAEDSHLWNQIFTIEGLLSKLGIRIYGGGEGRSIKPWVYIDDLLVEDLEDELFTLQTSNIKQIEYFTPDPSLLIYSAIAPLTGVLLIYLKEGNEIQKSRPLSFVTVQQKGWQPPVEFYSPQYPLADKSEYVRPDYRTTLYWNPRIVIDETGKAQVRFYASDVSRRYHILLEGVSEDGTVVHSE